MNPASLEIVRRYLAGELDLEAAARELRDSGDSGLQFSPGTISAEDQERIEALFGRAFWLAMRDANPAGVPSTPFGAKEFRALVKDMLDSAPGEGPGEPGDPDPEGAA